VNYYEHHIGDYAEATAHLSLLEDAVYSRLLRKYYATEQPLPADLKKVQRLVGARSKDELAAVVTVLEDFFTLEEDGYHNARCDREIDAFNDGKPERDLKKKNETNRMKRHRDERSRLFQVLTDAGGHADWNIKTSDLRELVKRVAGVAAVAQDDANASPVTRPATAPATPATATQTPDTRHHLPINQGEYVDHHQGGPVGPARPGFEKPDPGSGSGPGSEAAAAMVAAGVADASATHPRLLALLAAGLTVAELQAAAVYAVGKGAGFAYALARAEGQRRDAAAVGALPDAPAVGAADPDSRAAIEADAVRLGVPPWQQVDAQGRTVSWLQWADTVRKARVEGVAA
jgi:uncharacterized protein YdaU (DUF1376 family)